jgi:hypothetical protein
MKKLLALVLALVMTLGLAMVGTNAAFKDADKINNQEAVDVMAAVGVLKGDENGNFNPKDNIHRDAAAKIISYLVLGDGAIADAIPGGDKFSDVPANNWAAGYIAYCESTGIINGDGAGHFFPANNVTGYEFGKMLLVALGYDAKLDGMTGENWQVNTAKLMKENELLAGVSTTGSAAITREEAAQMAFNALMADQVKHTGGSTVTVGDVTFSGSSNLEKTGKTLAQDLYPALKLTKGVTDEYGHPSHMWKNGSKTVGLYPDAEPDVSFVADAAATSSLKAIQTNEKNTKLALDGDVYLNGEKQTGDVAVKAGDTIEAYLDGNTVTSIVIVHDDFGALTITANKKTAKKAVYDLYEVGSEEGKIFSKAVEDDDVDNVVIDGTVANGDYVLYHTIDGVLYLKKAEIVEGKIDATKGGKFRLDGTYYTSVLDTDPTINSEGIWALNAAGELAGVVEVTEASSDFAYIYSIVAKKASGSTSDDGLSTVAADATYKVYVVLADGTKASYDLVVNSTSTAAFGLNPKTDKNNDKILKPADAVVKAYTLDGTKFSLANPDDTVTLTKISNADVNAKDAKLNDTNYADASTEFVFIEVNATKATVGVSAKTGYKNVDFKQDAYVISAKNVAKTVFVEGGEEEPESEVLYAVLLDDEPINTKTASGADRYTYTVAIDGEESELTFKAALSGIDVGEVFAYEVSGGVAKAATLDLKSGKVGVATADYFYVEGTDTQFSLASGAKLYTITIATDGSATVDAGGRVATGAQITYKATSAGSVSLVYITVVEE